MKENKGKCRLIVSSNKHISMKLDNIERENSHCERLLGGKIDSKINFKEHLDVIIKNAPRKINVLSYYTLYEYCKTKTIDEFLLRVTVQLLSFGMDVSSL